MSSVYYMSLVQTVSNDTYPEYVLLISIWPSLYDGRHVDVWSSISVSLSTIH